VKIQPQWVVTPGKQTIIIIIIILRGAHFFSENLGAISKF
jgi:hypothetical protein